MFCGECGTENLDGDKFCKECGKPLQSNVKQIEKVKRDKSREDKPKKEKTEPKKIGGWLSVAVTVVLLLATAVVTNTMVNNSLNEIIINNIDPEELVLELEELTADQPVVEGLYEATDKPRNEAGVAAFTQAYGGVWYLTKEYTDKMWQYHDLTKKLIIFAWNNFNDYETQEIIGSYKENKTRNYYYNGRLVASEDMGSKTKLIYGNTKRHDGFDIKYNERYIILTDTEVDLEGIDGPIFSIEDFRYENIYGYDYLISDIYGFGLVWDGTYLEYCEKLPNKEYYQGQYAFRSYSMDAIISQDYYKGDD